MSNTYTLKIYKEHETQTFEDITIKDLEDHLANTQEDDKCYLQTGDAQKFLDFAANFGVYVGVRRTGMYSIIRLKSGAACKPHDILDKTLKGNLQTESDKVDKLYALVKIPELDFAGLGIQCVFQPNNKIVNQIVPYETKNITTPDAEALSRNLDEVSDVISTSVQAVIKVLLDKVKDQFNTAMKDESYYGMVGWWATLQVTSNAVSRGRIRPQSKANPASNNPTSGGINYLIKVPLGILRVGPRIYPQDDGDENKIAAKYGVQVSFQQGVPPDPYSGDYDLHEVYINNFEPLPAPVSVASSGQQSPPQPQPPSEPRGTSYRPSSAGIRASIGSLETLGPFQVRQMANSAYASLESICHWLNVALTRDRMKVTSAVNWNNPEPVNDRYSQLIQHGPQNLYEKFVEEHNLDDKLLEERVKYLTESITAAYQAGGNDRPFTATEVNKVREETLAKYEKLREEWEAIVDSLTEPDAGGVALFTPPPPGTTNQVIYILEGKDNVRKCYGELGIKGDSLWLRGRCGGFKLIRNTGSLKVIVSSLSNPAVSCNLTVNKSKRGGVGQTQAPKEPVNLLPPKNPLTWSWELEPGYNYEIALIISGVDDATGKVAISREYPEGSEQLFNQSCNFDKNGDCTNRGVYTTKQEKGGVWIIQTWTN